MHVATLYTLYGRRAGAEMCFEKALEAMRIARPDVQWTVFCNQEAQGVLQKIFPGLSIVYIPWLDSQVKKAVWLEFLSARALKSVRPDVFWIPSGCNSFPGRWAGLPTLTTFHDLGEYRIKGKYDFKRTFFRKRICIPRAIRRSAAFTAVSRFTADDLARFLGLRERVRVIHNGPSPHQSLWQEDAPTMVQKRFALNPSQYLFVPGRTDYTGKGLDLILDAVERRRDDLFDGDIQVVFVGPKGDGHEAFLAHMKRVDPAGRDLRYLGRVENCELAALYQSCLATVLPSRFEGFGFPVLEAMDYGVPVLCSDAGSLPEVAGNGALFFHSGEVDDLCEKLEQLIRNPQVRERLARAGKGQSARFPWETCGRDMMAALCELTGS